MTIQEAIRSGKPFKRKTYGHRSWIVVVKTEGEEDRFRTLEKGISAEIWPSAILANDWEIKDEHTTT